MGLRPLFYFFQCGDRLYTSESDVYRRQILSYKDGPRAERVKTHKTSLFEYTVLRCFCFRQINHYATFICDVGAQRLISH